MSELPPGWAEATVGEITSYVSRGKSPKYTDKSRLPVVNQKAIRWHGIQDEHLKYVHEDQFDQWTTERFIQAGDILWNSTGTGTIGRACLVRAEHLDPPKVVDSHVTIVRPIPEVVDPRFLFAWVRGPEVQNGLEELASGSTNQIELNRSTVVSTRVPVAPLPEQKRIADKLDALLARVDACRGRLDRVPGILKRFRQSVLAAATSGELTREWREERGLDEFWDEGPLQEIIESKPRNGYSPKSVEHATSVKSLTLTATTTGRFRGEYFKYIDEQIPADSHLWLRPGDVLIQRANTLEYVGVSAIFDGPESTFIYPDLMMKCRANKRVLPAFLHLVLSSQPVRKYFRENATGTAGNMPKINQQTVLSAPAVVPSVEEQQEIVARTTELLSMADALQRAHTAVAMKVKKLTPAALAKAFRGELVPQDPNDEPASRLLARLRTRPASAGNTAKPKRAKAGRS